MRSLSKEQKFFINTLKDYLLEQSSEVPSNVDWDIIKNFADRHQVTAVLYKQTKEPRFQKAFAYQLFRYTNFNCTIDLFKKALSGYEYLIVKGAVLANLYQVPALRSMGDIDTLIHYEARESVKGALLNAGFEFKGDGGIGEIKYSKNGYLFEIHDSLVHRYNGNEELVNYFLHVWDYVENGQINWSFHLIYLIEHLRQHFVDEGVGFRQFMDIAIVCKKCSIDWNFVSEELQKIKLLDFALTVFAFVRKWFEIEIPIKTRELSDEFFVKSTQKIFDDGVFGFDNADNKETELAFQMHYKGIDYQTARKEYIGKKFFPRYEEMCKLPYCEYVKKGKWLLPIAWIHRIIYRCFSKQSRDNMKQQLSTDKVMNRVDMLTQWGL